MLDLQYNLINKHNCNILQKDLFKVTTSPQSQRAFLPAVRQGEPHKLLGRPQKTDRKLHHNPGVKIIITWSNHQDNRIEYKVNLRMLRRQACHVRGLLVKIVPMCSTARDCAWLNTFTIVRIEEWSSHATCWASPGWETNRKSYCAWMAARSQQIWDCCRQAPAMQSWVPWPPLTLTTTALLMETPL